MSSFPFMQLLPELQDRVVPFLTRLSGALLALASKYHFKALNKQKLATSTLLNLAAEEVCQLLALVVFLATRQLILKLLKPYEN